MVNCCKTVRQELEARVKKLESIVKDYEESYKMVIEDRCPKDEVHCGCVAALRMRVKQLTQAISLCSGSCGHTLDRLEGGDE